MYTKPGLIVGPAVLGATVSRLPFTGFSAAAYVLLALALLVIGLLLARAGQAPSGQSGATARRDRVTLGLAAIAVAGLGVGALVFSGWWRGAEAWGAAHGIHLVTSHATTAVTQTGFVVMHKNATSVAAFALTNECTMAQIFGAVLIGGAPLLLVRRLSIVRVTTALAGAGAVLLGLNLIRLTAIGVAVLAWGNDGFAVAHTYLGSLITFVGTCLAGVTFALILIARTGKAPEVGPPGVACS